MADEGSQTMRENILRALDACIEPADELVVVHSSLPHLRPPAEFSQWDVLWAIRRLVDRDHTLAFPTFTFDFCSSGEYSHRQPSESGVLGDWVLELRDAVRTPHPIYSFAVIGPLKERLAECEGSTAWGEGSVFELFEEADARLTALGSGLSEFTQYHRYEEQARVPYRHYKTFEGMADYGDGPRPVEARMYVRNLEVDAENNFEAAVSQLQGEHACSADLWEGNIEAVSCQDLARVSRELLEDDPWAFVTNPRRAQFELQNARDADEEEPLRLSLLGSSNLEFLQQGLNEIVPEYIADRRIETYTPPYGQAIQEIVNPRSDLSEFDADFGFFVDRPEDLIGESPLTPDALPRLRTAFDRYLDSIRRFRKTHGGQIVVHRLRSFLPTVMREASSNDISQTLSELNERMGEELGSLEQVHLFDPMEAAAQYSGEVADDRLWSLGRFPFSAEFSYELARRYLGMILADSGRTARLIALDLDETLWAGILGEDGIEGLQVGGDYPGNAHAQLQRVLKGLSDRGIALALCSKNDEDYALEAISELSGMILTEEDFVSRRINWRPKWQNLGDIAEELNLGLSHVLFVDDNPVEREQMRMKLPEVKVLDLPEDPAGFAPALLKTPWLEIMTLTEADRKRAQSYRARRKLQEHQESFQDMTDFYASLDLKLYMQPLEEGTAARALQLLTKTNQFNATTRRHDRDDLRDLQQSGAEVVVVGAEDRFNERENIGVIIVRWDHPEPGCALVDTYLLSCRALGRGIETGALEWLKARAAEKGMDTLIGEIIETERNTPVRSVYEGAGFVSAEEPGHWHWRPEDNDAEIPDWLEIIEQFDEGAS